MSNDKSLENYSNTDSNAFSGEFNSEEINKPSGLTPAKKTARKRALTVSPEPVTGEQQTSGTKNTTKKTLQKKVAEINAEPTKPKPAKAKKSGVEKTKSAEPTPGGQKVKTRKTPQTAKQPPPEEILESDTTQAAVQNPATDQEIITGEHSVTVLPAEEPEKSESENSSDEQVAYTENTAESEIELQTEAAELLANEDVAADEVEMTGEPETLETSKVEQESTPEEKLPDTEEQIVLTQQEPYETKLEKITFQIKFHTKVGQSLYVTGNSSLLGNNAAESAFQLSYANEEYWSGTLEIPADEPFTEDIVYNYLLQNIDGTYTKDWGSDKVIQPAKYTVKELVFIDSWNASSLVENTFYTEPFTQVLLKENFTEVSREETAANTHVFKVKTPFLNKGETLCIIGSTTELRAWNQENPVLLPRKKDDSWFTVSVDLSKSTFPFTYKYGIFNTETNTFTRYEDGKDRVLNDNITPGKLTIISDGFAVLPLTGFKGAGVVIPVFSLRSEKSFGVGEFADIKLLVDWAIQTGMKLIQILPVNDTTATHSYTDSYPYAAISAFALHPLYLHLPSLVSDENNELIASFEEKRQVLNREIAVDYVNVLAAKWAFIKEVFPAQKEQVFESVEFNEFFAENAHWLVPYAAFSYFREKYNTADFNEWPTNNTSNLEEVNKLAASPADAEEELSIYYYVQFYLHLQLQSATRYAHENGIIVKGDIPIGIYRYSCDAWQAPQLFNMDMQAGAPPDDFAVKGQNWGFPTYNWQQMREDSFTWWKNRFKQMSYYFDAFRIDHILGFFRIWSIPVNAVEGIMGHFVPAVPVYKSEFTDRGISFDKDRFCKPFIHQNSQFFGNSSENVANQFLETSANDTYTLKPEFDTQRKVEAYFSTLEPTEQNQKTKAGLFDLLSNVILFEESENTFHFRIAMDSTLSFQYLDGHTQYVLKELYLNYFYRRQDSFWEKEAMLKLPELKRSTNMLICGEDLGMVPDCVPGVMKDLAILSLEIQRMPKDPKSEFFHPNAAPYLSVVTPSTHDMSTIRGWWEEDRAATQRFFNNELGQWGTAPYFCEPWICRIILMQHFYSSAMWSIFQLQDLLSTDAALRRENPHEERINIPANPKHYWRYRMHVTLESLIKENEFNTQLKKNITQSGR